MMDLKRSAYPSRYADVIPRFERPVPELCMISNYIQDHIMAIMFIYNFRLINLGLHEINLNILHTRFRKKWHD